MIDLLLCATSDWIEYQYLLMTPSSDLWSSISETDLTRTRENVIWQRELLSETGNVDMGVSLTELWLYWHVMGQLWHSNSITTFACPNAFLCFSKPVAVPIHKTLFGGLNDSFSYFYKLHSLKKLILFNNNVWITARVRLNEDG